MFNLLLGHAVGDFLFQNKWMALSKGNSTWRCLVHCIVYTLSVCAFTSFKPVWALVVFVSHFPIDRWSLADKWLMLIGGRSLVDFMLHGEEEIPEVMNARNYHALRGGFAALVYCVVDNTMHLLIMYLGYKLIF